jgi:hypothetical protein
MTRLTNDLSGFERVVEHHDVADLRVIEAVGELVDDQAILVGQRGRHALPLDAGDLEAERHDERRVDGGRGQRLQPGDELLGDARQPQRGGIRPDARAWAAIGRGGAARHRRHRLPGDERLGRRQRRRLAVHVGWRRRRAVDGRLVGRLERVIDGRRLGPLRPTGRTPPAGSCQTDPVRPCS